MNWRKKEHLPIWMSFSFRSCLNPHSANIPLTISANDSHTPISVIIGIRVPSPDCTITISKHESE